MGRRDRVFPPTESEWACIETKFDGYRIEAQLAKRDVRLLTRKGLYLEIASFQHKAKTRNCRQASGMSQNELRARSCIPRPFVPRSGTSSCEGQEVIDLFGRMTRHRSQKPFPALLEFLENA
jgi:hypothetical protein